MIRGPAVIGPGARIISSYIGPFTSIGKDVEINKSEIEHSIVLEGSLIHDLETRVSDSLIGRGVKIHRLPLKPVAHRFMLGDNSEVWIMVGLVTGRRHRQQLRPLRAPRTRTARHNLATTSAGAQNLHDVRTILATASVPAL